MTAAERIAISLAVAATMSGLIGSLSLAAHTAHVWPGMTMGGGLWFLGTMYLTRRRMP